MVVDWGFLISMGTTLVSHIAKKFVYNTTQNVLKRLNKYLMTSNDEMLCSPGSLILAQSPGASMLTTGAEG